jgi:RNA polymerase sigma-70 factor (ECF subfamily)
MTDIAERLYERVLVLRCQAGDEAAFEELVARYSPRLRYYLRKILGEVHAGEDALQDVWFDVFRNVPGIIDPGAFAAWIYRIARDRAFRELRKRKNHRPIEDAELADPSADNGALLVENAETIHAALDHLAPEHRDVLVLRFLEEMSYEDIKRVTGCQLGTVKSRLHYAKSALRRALERMMQHD